MQPGAVRADLLPLPAARVLYRHRAKLEVLQGEMLFSLLYELNIGN